jgi:hypothetical protein
MAPPGFGKQPQSRAVRVTVVGHASTRWQGAASAAEAARLNEALSKQRADNVRAAVEQILRLEVPGVTIAPGSSSTGNLEGVQVGSYGVGSREPVLNPVKDPNDRMENDPLNRSVRISIELITTEYHQAGASLAPRRMGARTKFWYLTVVDLLGASAGGGVYHITLTLRNSLSGKTALYKGMLFSGGLATPSRTNPKGSDKELSFYTDEEMGFDDFDGQDIRIEKVGAALGLKAGVGYLSFLSLGSGASMIPFEKTLGFGIKPKLEGVVISGSIGLAGDNPGDFYEGDSDTVSIPYSTSRESGDSLIVGFPTGKAAVTDLAPPERSRLDTFVKRWASQF